ncbi:MAG: hypothetical protein WC942_08190 [Clostridia bacterium]|jgi:hypothetical protein
MKIFNAPYSNFITRLFKALKKYNVEYMVIGGISSVIQGFNHTTQDIDIYPKKSLENNQNLIKALKSLKFKLSKKDEDNILQGKDFIQFDEPYEIDIVFSPDGFENYESASKYRIVQDGVPLLSIEGIIKSKKSANRAKDKLILPSLQDFLKFKKNENYTISDDIYEVPKGYRVTDIQTLRRWEKNKDRKLNEKLLRGLITI